MPFPQCSCVSIGRVPNYPKLSQVLWAGPSGRQQTGPNKQPQLFEN